MWQNASESVIALPVLDFTKVVGYTMYHVQCGKKKKPKKKPERILLFTAPLVFNVM